MISSTITPISPFSLKLIQKHQSKHNPKFFIPHTNPNSISSLPKTLLVSHRNPTFTAAAYQTEPSKPEEEKSYRKIPLTEVVVTKERPFWNRKWNSWDINRAIGISSVHILSLFAPFYFNWLAIQVAVGLSLIAATAITLSYHRNLSHRSFTLPKWLEYLFAWCGTLAFQGDPIEWVSNHRYHHQFVDTERDPHTPRHGFWFSYFLWVFDTSFIQQKCGGDDNATDLKKQSFYRFLKKTWIFNNVALSLLLYFFGGFPFLVWGMGVRNALVLHSTFLLTVSSHLWGTQPWKSGDLSRNTWWLALVTLGESWHNNHHAFEYSARHGLEWWQIDITWYIIRLLQALGLATDVKLVSEAQKQKMA